MNSSDGSFTANPAGSPMVTISDQTGTATPTNEAFDRFANLAGKLAKVPKHELEEQRKTAS